MAFIWDDNKYFLVDDEDEYDRSRYVVARKLFVTPNEENVEKSVSVHCSFQFRNLFPFHYFRINSNLLWNSSTGVCESLEQSNQLKYCGMKSVKPT